MRNCVILFLLSLTILSCQGHQYYDGALLLINDTPDTLWLKMNLLSPGYEKPREGSFWPNQGVWVAETQVYSESHDYVIEDFISNTDGAEVSIYTSNGGTLLKRWSYEGRRESGKQFFDLEDYDEITQTTEWAHFNPNVFLSTRYLFRVTEDMLTEE
ncbi:MAG: hypothetical protein II095_00330 [Bacteroidales bacterium]|nr:hypothetical protein [Bacteroidales bacterium]